MSQKLFWALACSATLSFSVTAHASKSDQLADWATSANQTKSNIGYQAPIARNSQSQYKTTQANLNYSNRAAATNPFGGSWQNQSSNMPVQGQAQTERYPVGKPTLQCVIEAANRQNVPVDLLLAINSIERGKTGQYVGNTNGTQDIGAFQINSIHLPRAATFKASPQDLATRGCYNAEFAALLLSEALKHRLMQNKDVYTRAAGYHSWTPKHNAVYKKKLVGYLQQWQTWLRANNMQQLVTTR